MDNEHPQLEMSATQETFYRNRIIDCEKHKSISQGEVIPLRLGKHSFAVIGKGRKDKRLGKIGANRRA